MRYIALIALLPSIAACGPQVVVQGRDYLTIDHAFTESGAAQAAKRADALCAQTRQKAEKVSSACSLERCTTQYYCVSR